MPSSRASIARASQLEWFHQRRQRHLRRLPSIEYHVDEGGCQQGETQQANVERIYFFCLYDVPDRRVPASSQQLLPAERAGDRLDERAVAVYGAAGRIGARRRRRVIAKAQWTNGEANPLRRYFTASRMPDGPVRGLP